MLNLLLKIESKEPKKDDFTEPLFDKIARYCAKVDGPDESGREWSYLKHLYCLLRDCRQHSDDADRAFRMIEPTIMRRSGDDPEGGKLISIETMSFGEPK